MEPARFFSNPRYAPMPTECNPALFALPPVGGPHAVASFGGGAIGPGAGALLLGQPRRPVRLTERFAACFADVGTPELAEPEIETLVTQRVVSVALGYRGRQRPGRPAS
jgi:hypothetical protein